MVIDRDSERLCQALLQRAGRGDTAAFAEFYDRTAPAVFGLIRSVLPDVGQAERTTLEVYRHAWRTASRYDPRRDEASSLLMMTARRYVLEQIRTAPSCAQLPASAREVLLLVHFGGQTVGEAAELLGLPEATVIRRLNDALSSLRHSGLGPAADPQTEAAEASVPRQREDA